MPLKLPIHSALQNLPVYQPGRPIEEVARELRLRLEDVIKLASNENPLGPSPSAMAAMEKALHNVHLYPDGNAFYLKRRLTEQLDVTPANLVLGNGSNEIIEFVSHALLDGSSEVVVSQYCFAIYPIMALMFGARPVVVPAKDHGHDLAALAAAITPRTRIVYVANPNNPTGTLASREAVLELIDAVPENVLLVMDEAYIEFLDDPVDLLPVIRDGSHPNLILMRTFSKIHGLAGLRLGYGIGHPELISALEKVRQPFNINSMAQAAALAAIDDMEHTTRTRQANREGVKFLQQAFARAGLEFVPSHANFVLVKVGDGKGVFEALQRQGIIVRPMAGYQLPEWIRISVGTSEENERCLRALEKVVGTSVPDP